MARCKALLPPSPRTSLLLCTLLCLISVGMLLRLDWVQWRILALSRLALIQALPLWDWRPLFHRRCLLDRPKVSLGAPRCVQCQGLDVLRPERDVLDATRAYEEHLLRNIPLLAPDRQSRWAWRGAGNASVLLQDLARDREMQDYVPCSVLTDLVGGDQEETLLDLLERASRFKRWFAHIQICDLPQVKALRRHLPRPPYLHAEVSPVQSYWLVMGSGYAGRLYRRLRLVERYTAVAQLSGSTRLALRPAQQCAETCQAQEFDLDEGQTLLFGTLWDLEYIMPPGKFNLAVVLEAN